MREQLVYELVDVDPEEGVDIFEIAPVLMEFGQLVRNANSVLDLGLDIDVRIKPFRQGSWITEFVLHGGVAQNLWSLLKSDETQTLALLLALLGLDLRVGIMGIARIIRFTAGKVSNHRVSEDRETVTYFNESGQQIVVSLSEHALVQSPIIQVNYYNSLVAPLDKFPTATAVAIRRGNDEEVQRFTDEDKPAFDEYGRASLSEGEQATVSLMADVYLKPRRGSYAGQGKQYSFQMGETPLWPVTIEDERFLERLRTADVRLFAGDLLKVDLEARQRRDAHNNVSTRYAITRVSEYTRYEKPEQQIIDGLDD